MQSLQSKAISSIRWTTFQTIFIAVVAPLMQILKARFLTPQEFAYLSIIMIAIGLFQTIENLGISQAVIQRSHINTREYSSLFFFNIFISTLCAFILFIAAPQIAGFYSFTNLDHYLKITSLIVLINGPSLLFRAALEKHLIFNVISITDIIRTILNLTLLTIFLFLGYGILSVIYGQIISTLFSTTIIIIVVIRRKLISVKLYFSFAELSSFLKFGVYVSGKSIFTFLTGRADELIIGYFLQPEILGYYYFGKEILKKLRDLIVAALGKVLFPIFSQIKEDTIRLAMYYRKISKYISMIAFPTLLGVAVTAHLFVPVIFGPQWNESIIVFQVFAVAFIFIVIGANVSNSLLYAVNKPNIVLLVEFFNVAYIISLILFSSYGVEYVLLLYSSYSVSKVIFLQHLSVRHVNDNLFNLWYSMRKIIFASLIMYVLVLFSQKTILVFSDYINLIGSIIIGILSYSLLILLLEKKDFKAVIAAFMGKQKLK